MRSLLVSSFSHGENICLILPHRNIDRELLDFIKFRLRFCEYGDRSGLRYMNSRSIGAGLFMQRNRPVRME